METPTVTADNNRAPRGHLFALGVLLVVVVVTHGASLGDGLFFDDYWHRVTLRECGWGFDDLVESATFDLPGRLVNLWWLDEPLQWRYARPVAMVFMKIEYALTGGNPVGIHACAMTWHLATGFLVYLLACKGIGHRGWALLAGAFFLMNPHAVFAISWVAARNALISAFFFAASVLLYMSATRAKPLASQPVRLWPLVGSIALWALALFSRESAIVFPGIVVAIDLFWGGWRQVKRRVPVYALLAVLSGAYLYWRLVIFPVADVPDIYFSSPAGFAYVLWAGSKLMQMLFSLTFYTPMFLGITTYEGLSTGQLAAHAVMFLLLGLIVLWYAIASRGLRGRWFWPIWSAAALAPVIPVFIMPHFSYLPFIGHAVFLAVLASRARGRRRVVVTTLMIIGTLWSLGVYRFVWRGIVRSEQLLYADIEFSTSKPEPGTHLFFINWPIAGIYAPVALRDAWGVDDLEGHILTVAPHPLMMQHASTVERINDYELVVSTDKPQYFSGVVGGMLIDGMRSGPPLSSGSVVPGEVFDTTIVDGNASGVRRLRFTFHDRLDNPKYRFYVSTPGRPAQRIRFDLKPTSLSPQLARWFDQARSADAPVAQEAWERIVQRVRPAARNLAAAIEVGLSRERVPSVERLEAVRAWCELVDVGAALDEYARWTSTSASMIEERDAYFSILGVVERVVQSDLFLTGDEGGP